MHCQRPTFQNDLERLLTQVLGIQPIKISENCMRNIPNIIARIASLTFLLSASSASYSQPSTEWKRAFPEYDHYIHESSAHKFKNPRGDTLVKVWSVVNVPATTDNSGKTFRSIKSLNTINCTQKTVSAILYGYSGLDGTGEAAPGPVFDPEESISPETFRDALWGKYCKSWLNWFK